MKMEEMHLQTTTQIILTDVMMSEQNVHKRAHAV